MNPPFRLANARRRRSKEGRTGLASCSFLPFRFPPLKSPRDAGKYTRMKSSSLPPLFLARVLPLICCLGQAMGAAVVPSWSGEAGTTHFTYQFSTGDSTPAPDIAQSGFSSPVLTVMPGFASSGWQDPGAEFTSPGVENDGAWDLGNGGVISISLPVAAAAASLGTTYRIDFVVYAVSFIVPNSLPAMSALGLSPQDEVIQDSTVEQAPPLSRWDSRTWTGYYEGVASDTITFNITAPTNGSTIDSFEVYTRLTVVPEPSSAGLAMLAGFFGCLRRRRG